MENVVQKYPINLNLVKVWFEFLATTTGLTVVILSFEQMQWPRLHKKKTQNKSAIIVKCENKIAFFSSFFGIQIKNFIGYGKNKS